MKPILGRRVSPRHRPVAIIGASGALGFGLAVRLGRAGVPIAIGSRDARRAQRDGRARARSRVPDGAFTGHDNAGAARAGRAR